MIVTRDVKGGDGGCGNGEMRNNNEIAGDCDNGDCVYRIFDVYNNQFVWPWPNCPHDMNEEENLQNHH